MQNSSYPTQPHSLFAIYFLQLIETNAELHVLLPDYTNSLKNKGLIDVPNQIQYDLQMNITCIRKVVVNELNFFRQCFN